jgi:hypothetical protein
MVVVPQGLNGLNKSGGAIVLPAMIGFSVLYSAPSVSALPGEVHAYAAVCIVAGLLALRSVSMRIPRKASLLSAAWVFVVGVLLANSIILQWDSALPRYVAGDLATTILPIAMMHAYLARPDWLLRTRPLWAVLALLFAAAILAKVVGVQYSRHDAPSVLLTAGLAYLVVMADLTPPRRLFFMCAYAGVVYLAFTSGYRTHLVLCLILPVVLLILGRGFRSTVMTAIALAAFAVLTVTLTSVAQNVSSVFAESRFESVMTEQSDASIGSRLAEIHDVQKTIRQEWSPAQVLLGAGFGSSYFPDRSYIEQNIGTNNRVHHIHVGPMLMFYRFGLVGVFAYLAMLALAVVTLREVRHGRCRGVLPAVTATAMVGFSIESLFFNASVQSAMGWSLGVLLAYRLSRSTEYEPAALPTRSALPAPYTLPAHRLEPPRETPGARHQRFPG